MFLDIESIYTGVTGQLNTLLRVLSCQISGTLSDYLIYYMGKINNRVIVFLHISHLPIYSVRVNYELNKYFRWALGFLVHDLMI